MFGNTITITSDKVASRLFRHLFLDYSKIPLIKHLDFQLEDDDDLPMNIHRLLLLAVHPTIESLTGSVKSYQFFKVLFDIVDSSSDEFTGLETVPLYTGPDVDFNTTVALKFKKSLVCPAVALRGQTTLAAKDLLKNLDQFPKLGMVLLRGHLDGLDWMEYLLRSNPDLSCLGIVNFDITKNFLSDMRSMPNIVSWCHSTVQQEKALKQIIIHSHKFLPKAIMYLCYKYPNVQYFELKGKLYVPEGRPVTDSDVFIMLNLILEAVKKIESKVIQLVLPKSVSLLEAMKFLPTREEDIEFSIEEINGQNELVLNLMDE